MLDPAAYTGLCADMARDQAGHARRTAADMRAWMEANPA